MIFKRLFQPKYQHKDPAVRIQALQQLNPQEPQQKTILHELAFNDSDASVSLAALDKLDNFDLWWKMAGTSKDQRVAKKSKSKVEAFLLGQDGITLPSTTRRTFILECHDNALLEMLLHEKALDENDTELMQGVLKKLNKPQLSLKILLSTENSALRNALFDAIESEADVAKIAKKAVNPELVELAVKKLKALNEAKEKPIQLAKEVRLLLSKLLALLECADYEKLVREKSQLKSQFSGLSTEFSILSDDDKAEFEQKFEAIQPRLDKREATLYESWLQTQDKLKHEEAVSASLEFAQSVLVDVKQAISQSVSEVTLGQLEQFNQQIEQAEGKFNDIDSTRLSAEQGKNTDLLKAELSRCRAQLDDLPALQTALIQANALIEQFKKLTPPSEPEDLEEGRNQLSQLTQQFNDIKSAFKPLWPKEVDQSWNALEKEWQGAIKAIEKQVDDVFKKCRDKLNFVNAQVKQGRFRNAIRHYEKVVAQFEALSESQQRRLSKAFEGIKADIENLKDWQDYIATPRKPEILQEINALAASPLTPEAQAKQVKVLRAQWLSLGSTGTESDDELNKAFDSACELAFKPCRDFYAEQDAHRAKNLEDKFALLDTLSAANTEEASFESLDKALNMLRKKWRDIGDIDYKLKDQLDQRYKEVVSPVKKKVALFYKENAALKQSIIDEANTLLSSDNWQEAANAAKQLQEKWKGIGRAQGKIERKLWESFRGINDAIFAKRDEATEARNSELESVVATVKEELSTFEQVVNDTHGVNDLLHLKSDSLSSFESKLAELPHGLVKQQKAKLRQLRSVIESKLEASTNDKSRQLYQTIFDALNEWADDTVPEKALSLGSVWKQSFLGKVSTSVLTEFDRNDLTTAMEIVCGADKSTQDEDSRKQVQLALMAAKLQGDDIINKDVLLQLWISKGELLDQDKQLLARIQPLYLSQ